LGDKKSAPAPTLEPTPQPTLEPTLEPTPQPTDAPEQFPAPESGCRIHSWKDVPDLPGGEGKPADGKHLPSLLSRYGVPGGRLEDVGFIKTPCGVTNPHEGTCAGECAEECESNPFCHAFEFIDAGTQYLGKGVRSDSGNDYSCKQFQAGRLGPVISTSKWSHGKRGEQPGSVGVCGKPGACDVAEGSCFQFYSVSVDGVGPAQPRLLKNGKTLNPQETKQFDTHTTFTFGEATPVDAIEVEGQLSNLKHVLVNGSHTAEKWVTLTAPYATLSVKGNNVQASVGKQPLEDTFVLRRDDGSCIAAGERGNYKLCRSSRTRCETPKVESGAFGEGCAVYKMREKSFGGEDALGNGLFNLELVSDTEPEDVCLVYDMSYDPNIKGVTLNNIACKHEGSGWVTSTWSMDRRGRVCSATVEGSPFSPADLPKRCSANGKSCSVKVDCLWAVPPAVV
jgi:hypothetical protein